MLSANCKSLFQRCLSTAIQSTNRCNQFAAVNIKPHYRVFSSNVSVGPLRSQPQYAVFGEKSMLVIKMLAPTLKCLKNGALVLEQNKKGRIMLEWAPRAGSGPIERDTIIRFALSPEEVGFLLHQLPDNEVEFVRRLPADTPGTTSADMPEKILRITPGEGGQFTFKIDFEKDHIGGQSVGGAEPMGPLEVVVQLGEYVVIRELMKASIPSLIGWDVQTNLAMQSAMNLAIQSNSSGPRSRPVASEASTDSLDAADL